MVGDAPGEEDVLERERDAGERRAALAPGGPRVGLAGGGPGLVGGHGQEGAELPVQRGDAGQRRLGQLRGRDRPRRDPLSRLAQPQGGRASGRRSLDDPRHLEVGPGLLRRGGHRHLGPQPGQDLVGPQHRRLAGGQGVGHGLDAGDVERLELLDVAQDGRELPGELDLLVGREPEPRQGGDAADLFERERQGTSVPRRRATALRLR